jgi:hypothetical protein
MKFVTHISLLKLLTTKEYVLSSPIQVRQLDRCTELARYEFQTTATTGDIARRCSDLSGNRCSWVRNYYEELIGRERKESGSLYEQREQGARSERVIPDKGK